MAKQLVGPVERHVEKAIVALAGVVLIAVIAKYLVTSPNQLEIGGEMSDPATIDRKVADKAAEVRTRIQDYRPVADPPKPLFPTFAELLELQLATEDPVSVAFAPAVPIIDAPEVIKGQKRLVEVVTFPKPVIVHGRSTLNLGSQENVRPIVDNWVTVSAVFDRKRQLALQKQQYGATQDEIIFGPVELQRRALRADGTWSDDGWEFVNVWPTAEFPNPPAIRLMEKDGQIVVPGDDLDDLEGFIGELAFEQLQVELLRPLMPDVINGDKWHFPEELMACRDLVLQDNEYLNPDAAEADDFEDRYGCMEAAASVEEVEVLTPRELIARKFKEGQKLMGKARKNWSTELAIDGYNSFADIVTSQSASGADKSRARKLMAECEQLMRDIERHGPDRGPGSDETIERELLPAQQVWVHDAGHDSVESGKTYQYRMRILLYNALAGEPTQFEAKQDATVVFVGGEWSEPSDPIAIPPDSLFFISGCDERKETVRVELYQWFDGVWVETRENFAVGAMVGQMKRCPVPIPDSKEDDRPEVPFDAGVTVVDIDFDRPYRDRKTVGAGVSFVGSQASTCSAVFANGAGGLEERFVPTDKAHPVRRRAGKLVYRPGR